MGPTDVILSHGRSLARLIVNQGRSTLRVFPQPSPQLIDVGISVKELIAQDGKPLAGMFPSVMAKPASLCRKLRSLFGRCHSRLGRRQDGLQLGDSSVFGPPLRVLCQSVTGDLKITSMNELPKM